ncbi:YggS family pyridoxal phosphate-dependent enzyme [uncultured Veillonella sp.]|uniref:YggS family pyridoxal phosphate-dependent enzyme n=1 Tax=uncultured Veillonella sp. TaxID=159268 RepID=UPI002621DC0C|nr:YggS family pyridoxal phosphate-dependent enzyme [uncultured Veillonella sp.]
MIEQALAAVQERIKVAMAKAGRTDEVQLVAVTKNHPVSAVEEVARLGITTVGENRVQEAKEKILTYNGPDINWHLIGHLQMNKVRQAVPLFSLIHSVDSIKLLNEIDKVAAKNDKVQDILLQVNVAEEASKSGLTVDDLPAVMTHAKTLEHVCVKGLMCMAPFFDNPEEARPVFREAHTLFEAMKSQFPTGQIEYLSMGMTHDFEVALEEGANIIRVGTAIFGNRVYF